MERRDGKGKKVSYRIGKILCRSHASLWWQQKDAKCVALHIPTAMIEGFIESRFDTAAFFTVYTATIIHPAMK